MTFTLMVPFVASFPVGNPEAKHMVAELRVQGLERQLARGAERGPPTVSSSVKVERSPSGSKTMLGSLMLITRTSRSRTVNDEIRLVDRRRIVLSEHAAHAARLNARPSVGDFEHRRVVADIGGFRRAGDRAVDGDRHPAGPLMSLKVRISPSSSIALRASEKVNGLSELVSPSCTGSCSQRGGRFGFSTTIFTVASAKAPSGSVARTTKEFEPT